MASEFLEWETTDYLTLSLAKAKIGKCLAHYAQCAADQ